MKYVVVRYDSEREITVVGKSRTQKEAEDILKADFEEWFWRKYATSEDKSFEDLLNEARAAGECDLMEYSAWLNECNHVDFDWTIIDAGAENILKKPYTMTQMYAMTTEEDTYVAGNVMVDIGEMTRNDFDGFLDLLSQKLTGSPLLTDMDYDAVEVLKDGCTIVMNVTGDASEILEVNDEFCEELKDAILKAGPDAIEDFTGMCPLDYHVERDLDGIFESTFEQMPDEELIAFCRKYCK